MTHIIGTFVTCVGIFTFSTFRVLTVQSWETSSDTFETRMSLNTDIGLLSSGQYLWQRIWNVINTRASDLCSRRGWYQSCTEPANVAQLVLSWALLGGRGAFTNTHSAFFITLSQHGDGAGACFPDHPPKVSHSAWQRTLGGNELIGAKVALEMQGGGGVNIGGWKWWGFFYADSRYSPRQSWRWCNRSPRCLVPTTVSLGCYCLGTV